MGLGFDHTLSGNKGNQRPSHVLFADVESRLSNGPGKTVVFTPFLWTCIYKRYRRDGKSNQETPFHGTDPTCFWNMVEAHTWERSCTYLATHHLEVDFMPLRGFRELNTRGWTLDQLICNGRTLILKYRKNRRKLVIMNNGNLFDSSIAAWGKILGIEKLIMPAQDAPIEDWLSYCQRDTEVVVKMWDTLLEFLDEHNLGNFKLTKASLALSAFKHRFMLHEMSIHSHPKASVLERRAYKGGRFEALRFGDFTDGPYYDLDVNSMYGFIESWAELPTELRGYSVFPTWSEFTARLKRYCVVATVEVETPEPFLPFDVDGRMKYRAGRFVTTLCTPELDYALKRGYILRVIRMTWYYKAQLLKPFARYFLDLKAQYDRAGNGPMRALAKIYCNAIYGKFAQRGFEDVVIGDCDPEILEIAEVYDADTGRRQSLYKYGGKVHLVKVGLRSRDAFVALAGHITAYARLYLWRLMNIAGIENVYHVATDALTVNAGGYHRLEKVIHPSKPGTLQLKGIIQNYSVKGINDVVHDGQTKIKGITKTAVQVNADTYTITEWPRITTLLRDGTIDGYYTRYRTKVLARPEYYQALGTTNPNLPVKPRKPNWFELLTEDEAKAVYEASMELGALRDSRRIAHKLVFSVWDYQRGTFRKHHDINGNLVPLEYTSTWGNLRELGFETDQDFKQAVLVQLSQDKHAHELEQTISAIWSNVHQRSAQRATLRENRDRELLYTPAPIATTPIASVPDLLDLF